MCQIIVSEETVYELYKNERKKINVNSQNITSKQLFVCDFDECNKKHKRKEYLKIHQNIHLGIKFACVLPQCKFMTNNEFELKRNALTHTNERRFICVWNQCFIKFNEKSHLINHKNSVHLRIKNFECNFDGFHQRFNAKNNVSHNPRVHSEDKPFICNYNECDMSFVTLNLTTFS
jgi:uncharacterized Zn-finger protein